MELLKWGYQICLKNLSKYFHISTRLRGICLLREDASSSEEIKLLHKRFKSQYWIGNRNRIDLSIQPLNPKKP